MLAEMFGNAARRRCGARAGSGGGCKRGAGLGWSRNLYAVSLVLGFGCGLAELCALRSVLVMESTVAMRVEDSSHWLGGPGLPRGNREKLMEAHHPSTPSSSNPGYPHRHEIAGISRRFLLASAFPFLQPQTQEILPRRPISDVCERENSSRSGCRRRRGSRQRPTWPRSRRSWRTRPSVSRTRTRARTCRSTSSLFTRRSSPSLTRPRPRPRQGGALRSNPAGILLRLIRLLCSSDVSFLFCGCGCAEEERGGEGAREGA
jgi:hypothetical protein